MKKVLLFIFVLLSLQAMAQNIDTRVFEMRTYYAEPGKLDDLVARFRNHTTKIFKTHGMENIGYWLPVHNDKNQIVYVLAYPSMEAREAAWKAFGADPKWKKVQQASEANGKLVNKVESVFMKATDFSPKIKASKKSNRVFELRTYTIATEKSADLLSRFRNHTMKLFENHGATNVAYWITIEKEAVEPQLIYFLAHSSEEAGKKAIDDFRKDPEWIKVRDASEVKGKLVESVVSEYMNALPFSKIR
jgi:hypothetical protein